MRFAKGHGTENDFVILLDPDGRQELTPALAARLCDRRAGVGADGVLRVVRTAVLPDGNTAEDAGWFMDYRNADGSPAEMCGNGIRVFARFLAGHGLVTEPEFAVATRSGPRHVRLEPDGNVTVDMGAVTVLGPGKAVVGGEVCDGLHISVGNPHLACLVDQPLGSFDLSRPPELDPQQFPDGANVELLRVTGPRTVAMRVHERGSGETRSCGTGAVAAAAAGAAAQQQGAWQVNVPGGHLTVTFEDGTAWLTGPAVLVAEGDLNESWLTAETQLDPPPPRQSRHSGTSNLRVADFQPLIAPDALLRELPLGESRAATVRRTREAVRRILAGDDDRLLVIVGPCSVHDVRAAVDYAERLAWLATDLAGELCVVMRVYFEKPRTRVGWKGLINDPGLDGGHDVHRGLRTARRLLLDILDLGLPVGCEFLDPTTPQYIADAVSWGAIGARTTESQVHRQLASGLSMPVGFKNGTDGSVDVAVDACRAAQGPHVFFGVDAAGRAAVVSTTGNPDVHIILRGGTDGPNYQAEHIAAAMGAVSNAGMPPLVMVDASHDNSRKDHERQAVVAREIASQVSDGQSGIGGVMIESFLIPGRQDLREPDTLIYGQSITDACMGWDTTAEVLAGLAGAVRKRRKGG